MRDASDKVVGFVKILRDESPERASQEALNAHRTELLTPCTTTSTQSRHLKPPMRPRTASLAMLWHELRNPLATVSNAAAVLDNLAEAERREWIGVLKRQEQ